MSKKDQLKNLSIYIGLRAAHEIIIKFTNKPESLHHLEHEADTYSDLSHELGEGNWDQEDIEEIKKLAEKKCRLKLEKYNDIGEDKYKGIREIIDNIMMDLGLI